MQYKESFSIELKRELNHDFKKEVMRELGIIKVDGRGKSKKYLTK